MTKATATREKLLLQARALLWGQGYSNVSLRTIAAAAHVDVALVSRYFGGKRGLFAATLDGAFDVPEVADEAELVETVVQMFTTAPRGGSVPSVLQLVLMNAHDEEVGDIVRAAHTEGMQSALETVTRDPARAALFMAVTLGLSVAEKSLQLRGIAPHDTPEYEAQLRHMLEAALAYSSGA